MYREQRCTIHGLSHRFVETANGWKCACSAQPSGLDCVCRAHSSDKCSCTADWTPQEVCKLKAEVQSLQDIIDAYRRLTERFMLETKTTYEILNQLVGTSPTGPAPVQLVDLALILAERLKDDGK